MLKSLFAAAALIIVSGIDLGEAGESNRTLQPSGVSGQRTFNLAGFDRVDLAGPFKVVVTVGSAHSVRAVGDTGLIERLDLRTEGSRLRIGLERGYDYSGEGGLVTIHVTTPALNGAAVAGSGDMQVSPFRARSFSGAVAGSGNLVLDRLQADTASFNVAGSGDLRGAGSAGEARVEVAGSGNVRLAGLETRRSSISIAGSGNAEIRATGEASVSIAGSGNVAVQGGARCSVSKVGSGTVRCGD